MRKRLAVELQFYYLRLIYYPLLVTDFRLTGCLSNWYLNEVAVDFDKAEKKENVLNGCSESADLCQGVECNGGSCTPNSSFSSGYVCRCLPGFSGTHCQQRNFLINTVVKV